jgi:transcriptional regulator with XRE-family HTH domain
VIDLDAIRRSLCARRTALGLSQAELARLMGTTQSAVSDLENGRCAPRIETLARWAEALGLRARVSIDFEWNVRKGAA